MLNVENEIIDAFLAYFLIYCEIKFLLHNKVTTC